MAVITTKGKFHLALEGIGLLLKGAPAAPVYKSERATVYGTRFASGDRDYNDFSQWWYFIQTDWSGGVKEQSAWLDDAKFYFSSNIDAHSKIGSLQLLRQAVLLNTFSENVLCGIQTALNPTNGSVGFNAPSATQATTPPGNGWTNPTNAYASDNSYATAVLGNGVYQSYSGFGFSVPAGATVVGVEVTIEAKVANGVTAPKISCYLTKDGNSSVGYARTTATLTGSDVTYTIGSPTDLWGNTISAAEANAAGFGISFLNGTESASPTPVTYSVDQIKMKVYYQVAATATRIYTGTYLNAGTSKPIVYSYNGSTWTDISSASINVTTRTAISQLLVPFGLLLISTVGTAASFIFNTYNGSAWVDQTSYITTGGGLTIAPTSSRCHAAVGSYLYVFVDNAANGGWAIVKTANAAPAANGDWAKVIEKVSVQEYPVDAIDFNGDLYYLVKQGSQAQLRMYDISASTDILLKTFKNCNLPDYGCGGRLLSVLNSKLVITIPTKEIWEYDGATLERIFKSDPAKVALGVQAIPELSYGGVTSDNKIHWGNLVYDGTNFYNGFKDYTDTATAVVYPIFVDANDDMYFSSDVDKKKLYTLDSDGTTYKAGASNSAFLCFSNYDKLQSIDKLLNSVVVGFDKLTTGQAINVYYTSNPSPTAAIADWTLLGTASYDLDGGTVVAKTLLFPTGTTGKKIWFRVELVSSSAGTPSFNDLTLEYLPLPDYKKQWTFYVDCSDGLKTLDGAHVEKTAREMKSLLEKMLWMKSALTFQDLDYAGTTLTDNPLSAAATTVTVASTKDFAEQGRIRIEDEEILYTGKTPTTFTGCTRGARGTRATSHVATTVVDNSYKVLFTDFTASTPILLKDKNLEYNVGVTLREV